MSPLRILLADDHEVVRAGIRALVDATPGMAVVGEATNGAETCARARELRPDAVLMDVSMPVLDRVAAAGRLRTECPECRILALTMHDDHAPVLRLLDAGAAGYVLKRAGADELLRAIRTVAAGATYMDPVLAGALLRSTSPRAVGLSDRSADGLSEREEEVLRKIAWGYSNKEIAADLGISTKTVETYKARITNKLGLHSRNEMVRYALRQGWLAVD